MNKKVDEYGNIYFFMTRKEMGQNLKASSKTVIKVFKELEKARLIKQENQGKGKAYKIYVVDIYSDNINKKYNYKCDRDYSNFDWTSLYANKF